jgi:hypothetical protein
MTVHQSRTSRAIAMLICYPNLSILFADTGSPRSRRKSSVTRVKEKFHALCWRVMNGGVRIY